MISEITNNGPYLQLVSDLSQLIEKGRGDALQALAEIRCQTYWAIGQRLEKAIASTPDKTAATQLVKKLAPDLHIHRTTLYRALQFYHAYPNALPASPESRRLPWSAHLLLLPIKNPDKRAFYLQRAIDSGWMVQSVVFTSLHLILRPGWFILGVLVPSLIFGYFRDRYRGVVPAILLHIFYNAGFFLLFMRPE